MAVPASQQGLRPERIYFAFGSNLHLAQMAIRCPESRYIGAAKLQDYRFQINQRGFANVVSSPGDRVEGLAYLLSQKDEERLNRSEGVPTAYQQRLLTVEVFTADIAHVGRAVPELARRLKRPDLPDTQVKALNDFAGSTQPSGNSSTSSAYPERGVRTSGLWREFKRHALHQCETSGRESNTHTEDKHPELPQSHCSNGQITEALVYTSADFQEDSKPRDEYIDRMNAGIMDARKFGMSDQYIATYLRRFIPYRPIPKQNNKNPQRRSPEGRNSRRGDSDPAGNYLHDRASGSRYEAKPLTMSAQFSQDKQVKHKTEGESDDSELAPYHPENETRDLSATPSKLASAVDKRRQHVEKDDWDDGLDPGVSRRRSKHDSKLSNSPAAVTNSHTRRYSRHRM